MNVTQEFLAETIGFIIDGGLVRMSRADAYTHFKSRGEYADWVFCRQLTTRA